MNTDFKSTPQGTTLCSAQEAALCNEAAKHAQKPALLQDPLPGRQPSKALNAALNAVASMHSKKDGRTH